MGSTSGSSPVPGGARSCCDFTIAGPARGNRTGKEAIGVSARWWWTVLDAPDFRAIFLGGALSILSATHLADSLTRLADCRQPSLVVDLGGIERIDSACMSVLVMLQRRLATNSRSVRFQRMPPSVLRLVSLLGLEAAFGTSAP